MGPHSAQDMAKCCFFGTSLYTNPMSWMAYGGEEVEQWCHDRYLTRREACWEHITAMEGAD